MIFISVIILIYSIMMFVFWNAWRSIVVYPTELTVFPKVSVVVIARNEEDHMAALLGSLSIQTYPHWELIIVDDHSTDATYAIASQFELSPEKTVLKLPDIFSGKKAGLTYAIGKAKGDFILCTDADCTFDKDWIMSMMACQHKTNARFVFGAVDIQPNKSIFSRIQRMEFWGLIGSGASSLAIGIPSMCNGANLLFERKAFNSVGGYADIQRTATGDDVLLMMKLRERFPDSVVFCKSAKAIVSTQPQLKVIDFVNQRRRWASKFNVYKTWGVKAIALLVFFTYVSILAALPLLVWSKSNLLLFLITIVVKLISDYLFLHELQKFYQTRFDFTAYILLQFIMPLYVTFFGILGRRKTFRWKERSCT